MNKHRNGFELLHQYAFEVVDFSSQYGSERGTGYTAANLAGPCQVYPNYCDSNATCSFRTYGRWWHQCPSTLAPIGSPPDDYTSEDYVDLYFDTPVVPTRLQVFETYNPGSIVRILACYRTQPVHGPVNTRCLKWVTLWKAPPRKRRRRTNTNALSYCLQLPCRSWSTDETHDDSRALVLSPINVRRQSPGQLSGDFPLPDIRETYFSRRYQQQMGHAYIFQPLLTNVPPFPTDLIRLEIDGSRCSYFPELDAVRLTGFAEIHPPGWPGHSSLEGGSLDSVHESQTPRSVNRSGTSLSFFSDLLRPCTPQFCLQDAPNNEPMDYSMSAVSPASSPDASPDRLCSNWAWLLARLQQKPVPSSNLDGQSTSLCRLPPIGMNALVPCTNHIVTVTPGTICPVALFGLTHLDETALWRHGPLTRLPYEILLHIFSYLDLQTLCRAACVSRQFQCLADDALSRVTNLNLQAYWPWLSDPGLLSLGKRLGCVNLAARAAAGISVTGNAGIPFNLLHYHQTEDAEGMSDDDRDQEPEDPDTVAKAKNHFEHRHMRTAIYCARSGTLASRMRRVSWRTARAATVLTQGNHSTDGVDCEECERAHHQHNDKQHRRSREWLDAFHSTFSVCCLRRLDMSWCGNYSQISPTAFGHFLSDCCRQLTTLRLSSCKFLNDDCVLHIVNTCGQLNELDLSSCTGISEHGFLTLGRLIHLRWLSLYRTHVTDAGLLSLAELCQHLQHINLGSCVDVQQMDNVLDHLTRNNSGLLSINLWRCVTVSAVGIEHITRSCPNLQELDLGWCRNVTITPEVNCITRLVQRCRDIRKLYLSGTSLLNADDLVLVAQCLGAHLEQLDIHSSTNITTSSVAALLSQCPRLRLLDVSFCSNIPLYSVIRLRQLFPSCTIVTSIPDLEADDLGGPVHRVIVDELIDEFDNPADELFGFRALWLRALPGRPEMLALPAPHRLAAIAGPVVVEAAAVD